jgi:hypothetical protein
LRIEQKIVAWIGMNKTRSSLVLETDAPGLDCELDLGLRLWRRTTTLNLDNFGLIINKRKKWTYLIMKKTKNNENNRNEIIIKNTYADLDLSLKGN